MSAETAIMEHPTLDGRPVLIGDRLIARCEWDEGPAADMEFVVIGIVPDIDDYRLAGRMSWTPLAEEFLFRGDSCRRAPDSGRNEVDR